MNGDGDEVRVIITFDRRTGKTLLFGPKDFGLTFALLQRAQQRLAESLTKQQLVVPVAGLLPKEN